MSYSHNESIISLRKICIWSLQVSFLLQWEVAMHQFAPDDPFVHSVSLKYVTIMICSQTTICYVMHTSLKTKSNCHK